MGFDKPSDLAWMFVIFASIIIVMGIGVDSVIKYQHVSANTSFFEEVRSDAESETGLKGGADSQRPGLIGDTEGDTPDVDNIFVRAWNAMKDLGKTFKIVESSIIDGVNLLGIDPIFWVLVSSALLITFAVIIYTWVRGRV